MRIDFEKLEMAGVAVDYNAEDKCIYLNTTHHNTKASKIAHDLCRMLEFSDMETDELNCAIYKIQMFKALKYASGG